MAQKRTIAAVAVVSVLLLIFIGVLCAVLYAAGSFPAFNRTVESVLPFIVKSDSDKNSTDTSYVKTSAVPAEPLRERIAYRIPSFSKADDVTVPVQADTGASVYSIGADGYSLRNTERAWTYESPYPIVTEPGIFADTVVFINAAPSLVCLDRLTGAVTLETPCPVYPAPEAYTDAFSYVFKARAGSWYAASFSASDSEQTAGTVGGSVSESDSVPAGIPDFDGLLLASFLPNAAVTESIVSKMNTIISAEPVQPLSGQLVYTESDGAIRFDRAVFSPLIVFSPAEQGMYTFGLCSKDGVWIKDNAFVAVFTGTGEMRSVSLDYVADRPQITMHLSDTEMYYICAGFMNPAVSDPSGSGTAASAYFQVKRAP